MPRLRGTQSAKAGPRLVRRTTPTPSAAPPLTDDHIAVRAYALFEQLGREHGHDLDHWLTAELELRDRAPAARPARKVARRSAGA
jgi:hypothetical protein